MAVWSQRLVVTVMIMVLRIHVAVLPSRSKNLVVGRRFGCTAVLANMYL